MNEIKEKKNKFSIIPVKLIGQKLVKIKEIPKLESKKLKNVLDTTISTSTEPSNRLTSNRRGYHGIDKFIPHLLQKYQKLNEDLKKDKEMVGTVEENIGQYSNYDPFAPYSNAHTINHLSKSKRVLFGKTDENMVVFKVLDSNLYLTIYNKPPPQKRIFRRSEINQIIKIQKKFKGNYQRKVERGIDRLKTRNCFLEAMLLLVEKAYDNAIKKIYYGILTREFLDPFIIDDEIQFEDKIHLKLPDKFYNISKIKNESPKKLPKKRKKYRPLPY